MFILVEQFKTGTVTIQTSTMGIDTEDFEKAKTILKKRLDIFSNCIFSIDNDKELSYQISNDEFPLIITYGELDNYPLNIIKE